MFLLSIYKYIYNFELQFFLLFIIFRKLVRDFSGVGGPSCMTMSDSHNNICNIQLSC